MSIAIAAHLLGALVWVGGMFFAHMVLRPTVNELLEPPQRLPLMLQVFNRFFPWVWLSIVAILLSGNWVFFSVLASRAPLNVHLMMGLGWIMSFLFMYIWFVPYRKMGKAVSELDWPVAAANLATIRRIILTNLILGLITSILATAGRYF